MLISSGYTFDDEEFEKEYHIMYNEEL